jgi:hypothetical protein
MIALDSAQSWPAKILCSFWVCGRIWDNHARNSHQQISRSSPGQSRNLDAQALMGVNTNLLFQIEQGHNEGEFLLSGCFCHGFSPWSVTVAETPYQSLLPAA